MKNIKIAITALAVASIGLLSFHGLQASSIKGKVTPGDGALRAWAISGGDTLRSEVSSGVFQFDGAKAGTYRVIIEAKPPYKHAAKDSVVVVDGQTTDVGEIALSQ